MILIPNNSAKLISFANIVLPVKLEVANKSFLKFVW